MRQLIRDQWKLLLFGFLMTFWSAPGQTFFVSLFSGQIRADLHLGHAEFGGLYSLATLISALVILWSGSMLDKVDLRLFSQIVALGLLTGCVALASSTTAISLLVAFFLLRQFGQGLMIMTASTSMVRYLNANKGSANALSGMGYRFSESLLPAVIVAVLAFFSWREILFGTAALTLLILCPAIFVLLGGHGKRHQAYHLDLSQKELSSSGQKQWLRSEVLKDKLFYLILPATSSGAFLFTGFIFHQVALVESKGWSLQAWGSWFIAYGMVSAIAAIVCGRLIDRYSARALTAFMPLPIAAALLSLATADSSWSAGLFLGLMAITTGMIATASGPLYAELYGTQYLGSIKSATSAAMVLASAVSPVAIGWLLDQSVSFETVALASACYAIFAAGIAAVALRQPAPNS